MIRKILIALNKFLPKFNHVVVQGFPNVEGSAVEVANYISIRYTLPVFYLVSKSVSDYPQQGILDAKVIVLERSSFQYWWKYFTAQVIFFTHGSPLDVFSKRQTVINIWHGIFYKNIGKLSDHIGIPANLTVGTSSLTRKMFAEAFGVPEQHVVISGYPRNDILIRSKVEKEQVKEKIGAQLTAFDKIILWLPTYRKSVFGDIRVDGKDVDNPFYIEDFDIGRFHELLKQHNILCLVKPHPMAPKFEGSSRFENLMFIDDQWISNKGITLYHLVGCSDILISDVSSIIIDYLLLDQPIICISMDIEEYKNSRGFYFDEIEKWIPSQVNQNQNDYFDLLESILSTGIDPFEEKRKKLKQDFFAFQDGNSTKRLVEAAFDIHEHNNG